MADEPNKDENGKDAGGSNDKSGSGALAGTGAAGTQAKSEQDSAAIAKELRKLRSEAKGLRARLKNAEAERDELKNAGLSDDEKQARESAEAKEARKQLEADNRELRVMLAAARLNIRDPEVAAKLLDWDEVENPDDPKAVERALKELVKDKEYLVGDNDVDGGAGRKSPVPGEDMDSLIRSAAGRA